MAEQLPLDETPVSLSKLSSAVLRFANQDGQPEIFSTVQGEGRNLGSPVVFARLSGCNLQCTWCDTPYTWVFSDKLAEQHDEHKTYDKKEETIELSVGEAVDKLSGQKLRRLVITGGEPMMQQKALAPMVRGLKDIHSEQWVELETNGTIAPTDEMLELVDQFNVSVKLANSGNKFSRRRNDLALRTFAASEKSDFKFVVTCDEDIAEILELVQTYKIPNHRVFLMPEGRTEEEVKTRQIAMVELAKKYNFNLTTRLHVLIWGAKRGV